MCTKERGRGRVYLFRRAHTANVTALEHDRVIKEMNSGYGGPPFHTPPPLPLPLFDRRAQPHLLRFASILGCRRTETDLRNPVSIGVDRVSRDEVFNNVDFGNGGSCHRAIIIKSIHLWTSIILGHGNVKL